jgi:hypothetical protein
MRAVHAGNEDAMRMHVLQTPAHNPQPKLELLGLG